MNFKYTVTDKKDYSLFTFSGSLIEIHQADDLLNEVNELLMEEKNKYIIDLSQLEFINQTGITILIKLLTLARINGGELIIFNLTDTIKKMPEGEKITAVLTASENELLAAALLA